MAHQDGIKMCKKIGTENMSTKKTQKKDAMAKRSRLYNILAKAGFKARPIQQPRVSCNGP